MQDQEPSTRIGAFDRLRFLAALVVLMNHAVAVARPPWLAKVFDWGALDSKSAVAFFFVLSGYVLQLSWHARAPTVASSLRFEVRRWFRIYPLYYLSLLLGALSLLLPLAQVPALRGEEVAAAFLAHDHHSVMQWLHHVLLVTPGLDFDFINPPIWTLAAEMRVSLLFPLLSWLLFRCPRGIAAALVAASFAALPVVAVHTIPTLSVVPLFFLGAFLARHLRLLEDRPPVFHAGLFALSAVVYSLSPQITAALGLPVLVKDYPAGIASAAVLVAVRNSAALKRRLDALIPAPLADASYGVYVLHFPLLVMVACGCWFWGWGALPLVALTLVLTGALAVLCHRLVEVPMIEQGRVLARRIGVKRGTAESS